MIVVDNSVVVDVFIGRLPVQRLGNGALVAPDLIDAEFLQVSRRHNRAGRVSDIQADRILGQFDSFDIARYPVSQYRQRVWELRYNLTAYDAIYVSLAESLNTVLLTTDARIARAPDVRCPVEVV